MSSTFPSIVVSRSVTAPPGSPNTIDWYVIPAGATGAWSGHTGNLTCYARGNWRFATPPLGITVRAMDEGNEICWTGTAWAPSVTGVFPGVTITTTAGIIFTSGAPGVTTNTLYQISGSLYFNGAEIGNLKLTSTLAGFTLGTDGSVLASTDTLLQAYQKIQVQLNAKDVAGAAKTITTASAVPFLTSTRSDLANSVTFTHTSAGLVTFSGTFAATQFNGSGAGLTNIPPGALLAGGVDGQVLIKNGTSWTWSNGGGMSLSSALTGFTLGTDGTALSSIDTVLQAFQKLQVQSNAKDTALSVGLASVQPTAVAAAIGPWQTYTPVWTAATTNPVLGNGSITGKYRRVGDCVEIEVELLTGSTTTFGSGAYYFSIPPGLTGTYVFMNAGTVFAQPTGVAGAASGIVSLNGLNKLSAVLGVSNLSNTNPATFSASFTNIIAIHVQFPVNEYTANINLLQNFTEYMSCDGTGTGEGVAASTTYGPASPNRTPNGSLIPAVTISSTTATTITTYQFTPTQPIKPADLLLFEVSYDQGASWCIPGDNYCAYGTTFNGVNVGVYVYAYNGSIYATFSNAGRVCGAAYGAGAADWSGWRTSNTRWRIRKVSNGNFAQGSPSYSQTIGDGASTTIDITHNLGVTDVNVTVFELTGLKRKVDDGVEVRSLSPTQVRLVFTVAPATSSLRVTVFSSGGTSSTAMTMVRTTSTVTLAALAPGATGVAIIPLNRSTHILSVGTDYPAWVRLYNDAASRTADSSRSFTASPSAGSGVVFDVVTAVGALVVKQSPVEIFVNNNSPTDTNGYVTITNKDAVTRIITLTIIHLPQES